MQLGRIHQYTDMELSQDMLAKKDNALLQKERMAAKRMIQKKLANYEGKKCVHTQKADMKLDKTEKEKLFDHEENGQYQPYTGYCS